MKIDTSEMQRRLMTRMVSNIGAALGSQNQVDFGRRMSKGVKRSSNIIYIARIEDLMTMKGDNIGTKVLLFE
jgi:hypothetical protein